MKKQCFLMTIFSLFILFFGFSTEVSAQQTSRVTPAQKAQEFTDRLDESVQLNALQKQKIYQTRLELMEKRKMARKLFGQERQKIISEARQTFRASLEDTLTPAQKAKWKNQRKQTN